MAALPVMRAAGDAYFFDPTGQNVLFGAVIFGFGQNLGRQSQPLTLPVHATPNQPRKGAFTLGYQLAEQLLVRSWIAQ